MILQQYIQDVLFRQQVCMVPRIGTFTLQYTPARYSVVDKSLDPPGQQVIFNEQWTDDGSCLEWISLKENLVPAVAQRKLDKYITDLKTVLETGRPLELPGIGTLQADTLGHLNFQPENLPGKPDTLHLQPVLRADASPRVTVGTTEVVNKEVVDHLTPYPPAPWELEEQQSRFKWWWVAIPIAAALAATAIWWFVSNQTPGARELDEVVVTAPATPDTMALPQEVTQTATSPVSAADTLQYYIVFAAYPSRSAAEKRFRKMKTWGLNVTMYSTRDSANFKLAMPFRSLASDTATNIETVRKNYGGKGEKVYLEF